MTQGLRELATHLGADVLRARLGAARLPTIDGKYVVQKVLGRGASGIVVDAWDSRLGRRVAVKLAPYAAESETLLNEARALARLHRPPNVVQVHDVGIGRLVGASFSADVAYAAMELVDGPTARSWLARQPRSRREILALFHGIARGLATVHAHGIVHGDVKGDNVLVTADGTPVLVDFGFATAARRDGAMETIGTVRGTWPYMAPETRRGIVGRASDVYGFANSLWEALVGTAFVPFGDLDLVSQGKQLWASRQLPASLARIVVDALEEDPSRRPTIEQLASAIAVCSAHESSGTPSVPASHATASHAAAPSRRSGFSWTTLGMVAFLGLFAWRRRDTAWELHGSRWSVRAELAESPRTRTLCGWALEPRTVPFEISIDFSWRFLGVVAATWRPGESASLDRLARVQRRDDGAFVFEVPTSTGLESGCRVVVRSLPAASQRGIGTIEGEGVVIPVVLIEQRGEETVHASHR